MLPLNQGWRHSRLSQGKNEPNYSVPGLSASSKIMRMKFCRHWFRTSRRSIQLSDVRVQRQAGEGIRIANHPDMQCQLVDPSFTNGSCSEATGRP
jgi:hypothetical protein